MIQFSKEQYRLSKAVLMVATLLIGINVSNADSINKHVNIGFNLTGDMIEGGVGYIQFGGGISYDRHRLKAGGLFDGANSLVGSRYINPRNFKDRLGLWAKYNFFFRDPDKTWIPGLNIHYQHNTTNIQFFKYDPKEVQLNHITIGPSLLISFMDSFAFNLEPSYGWSINVRNDGEDETQYSDFVLIFQGGVIYSW